MSQSYQLLIMPETVNRQPEIEGITFVALGSFNPAIFRPEWFSRCNLIREEEAEAAKIGVVSRDVTDFQAEWLNIQALHDRITIGTTDPTKFPALCDVIKGTFKILEHTPITAFGLNSDQHFRMQTEEEWHQLGHHYAPKESWEELLDSPGLRTLVMEGNREDCDAKRIQIRLQPSIKVHPGLFLNINYHYTLKTEDQFDVVVQLLQYMSTEWDKFIQYGVKVAEHLLNEAIESSNHGNSTN